MRHFSGLDELVVATGEHLGQSEWLEITSERIRRFTAATGWRSEDAGKRAHQGSVVDADLSAYLTLGLLPSMMREIFSVEKAETGVNFGLRSASFPGPVAVGARVRGGADLSGAQGVPGGWLVSVRMTVERAGDPLPACVANTLSLFLV